IGLTQYNLKRYRSYGYGLTVSYFFIRATHVYSLETDRKLFMAAPTLSDSTKESYANGMDSFISKPATLQRL
ncbi:unnamed protein product, partial [Brassica oleracea]